MLKDSVINFIKTNRGNSKRETFMLNDEALAEYIQWAFFKNCLFYSSYENGFEAIGIAYPLKTASDGSIVSVLPINSEDNDNDINGKDICIMDWIALSKNGRNNMAKQFFIRFPNWKNSRICGIHYGKVKFFEQKFVKKLLSI